MITLWLLLLLISFIAIYEFLSKNPVSANRLGYLLKSRCADSIEEEQNLGNMRVFLMRQRINKCIPFLPEEAKALTLGRCVFISVDPYDGYKTVEKILKHEYAHTKQYEKYGTIFYVVFYLFFLLLNYAKYRDIIKAYEQVPFEVEARRYNGPLP